MGLLGKFSRALSRSRDSLGERIRQLAGVGRRLDAELLEELEEALLVSDLGPDLCDTVIHALRERAKLDSGTGLAKMIEEELLKAMGERQQDAPRPPAGELRVILVVGVNGAGKTTTIGKLAHRLREEGGQVMIAAADTFRAAAIEQLERWAERAGAQLVKSKPGADPAAVAYDALGAAKARGCDTLLVDTAGRLQNKKNLMQELEKMGRVLGRALPGAPHEVLLVLDGTTGQNALSQARLFSEASGVNGLVVTKLDGTARGGIALAIHRELGLPLRWVGTGEGIDDLQPFDAGLYTRALFEELKLDE